MFGVLIAVHEFGHFITAKLFGIRVNEFSIGMGPALFKREKGETLYSLRLLPIGGFVAMEGENEDSNLRLAQYIATAAVCDGDAAPCGSCKNCHLAAVGSHPDITYIESLEGKKNLSVNQIRDLRADAFVRAHSAAHRVFVIKDAHRHKTHC